MWCDWVLLAAYVPRGTEGKKETAVHLTAMSCNVYGSVLYSSTCQQLQMTTTVTLCVDIWAWHKSTWSASAQLHCSAVTKIWPSKIQLRSNIWNPGQCYRNSGRHSISVYLKLWIKLFVCQVHQEDRHMWQTNTFLNYITFELFKLV